MNRSKKPGVQTPEARAMENQVKFIKEAVSKVEKNFGKLCGQMGSVNRRSSRLRDKFDEMAKFIVDYANTEPGTLKVTLTLFAEHISAVQDYRQALIDRMDGKVIKPLSQYEASCKHTQADLNTTQKSRGKQSKQHKKVETMRNKEPSPSNTQQITRAETHLQRATIDMERSSKTLEETIDKFETQRVKDIKQILSDYVQIEMLFHAKALERLTTCFQDLEKMNVDDHLMLFRNSLRPNQVQERLDLVRQTGGMNIEDQQQDVPSGDVYAIPQPRGQRSSVPRHEGDPQDYDEDQAEEYEEDYSEGEESDYESEEEEEEEREESPQTKQQRLKPW